MMLNMFAAAAAAAIAALVPALVAAYFVLLYRWWSANTRGLAYFGRPIARRRAFRAQVARNGALVAPLLRMGLDRLLDPASIEFEHAGLWFPRNACTPASVAAGLAFAPDGGDVIVASQMKCGTTWVQQIVYEVLSRGCGDLGDAGHVHLNALSPWLESTRGVALADAPRVGDRARRIVKTHLPASHCPIAADARYVYVTRHPVSCYASCAEFIAINAGPLARRAGACVDWFCSERMWWGSWPGHVAGWWGLAAQQPNVLFLHFEALKRDLPAQVRAVALFLAVPLEPAEIAAIVERAGFGYMRAREEWFEMSPPSLFAAGRSLFTSGSATRHAGIDADVHRRIAEFCRMRLAAAHYPLAMSYPDIADAGPGGDAPAAGGCAPAAAAGPRVRS